MQQPRVLLVIETFLPLVGGSEKQAFLQSRYLRAQGIEASILTLRWQQHWPAYELLDGVPVSRSAGSLLAWHDRLSGVLRRLCYLLALLTLGWQLWRERHRYDMLHVFQLSLFTLPALFVCRVANKSLVIGMRCDSSQARSRAPAARQWGRTWTDLDGLARLGKPALRLINSQLRQTGAYMLVLSTHMRESLQGYGLNGATILWQPNGVDTTRFSPCPERRERRATVVCVAQMRYQKGIDVLLHAWCQVVERMPEARLLLVGDGPLFSSLQALASRLGLEASVEFAGLCVDVPCQLQRGHVAVLPSRWEGMPNALLEAMACGLACVATRVSGSEDLLQGETRGLLVEPEDQTDLARALLFLLQKPEVARRYGQAARSYVEHHHSFEQLMQGQIDIYRAIARDRHTAFQEKQWRAHVGGDE